MAVVGNLNALLTCNSAGFTAGMTAAMGTTAKLGTTCTSVSGAVSGMAGAMGATAVAATGLSAKLWGVTIAAGAALKAMLPMVAVMAAFYGVFKAGKTAEEFNQAMASSIAIMGDIGDAQGKMGQIAKQVAFDTKFNNREVAESYYFLASAGLSVEQQMKALPFVAKFAQAGMFDMARATEMLAGAQAAMGLRVEDATQNLKNMTRVGDVLVKANTLAQASVEQFAEALSNKAAAAGRLANQSLEEVVSVLAAFAQQNRKGGEAGTAYNIVMREMTTKSLSNAAAWKAAGIEAYTAGGKVRYLADIIGDLEKKMGTLTPKEQTKMLMGMGFQAKSKIFIQMLLGQSEAMKGFKKEVQDAGGFTEDVASKQLPAFTDAMKKLWNILGRIAILTIGPVLELIGHALLLVLKPVNAVLTAFELLADFLATEIGKRLAEMCNELVRVGVYWGVLSKQVEAVKPPIVATAEAIAEVDEEIAKATTSMEAWVEKLKEEIEYVGKSARVIQLYRHAKAGAFKDQQSLNKAMIAVANLERMDQTNKVLQEQASALKQLQQAGKSVFESVRTPMEKYQATMEDLNKLVKVGAIDWMTYGRAVKKAQDEMQKAMGGTTDAVSPPAIQRGTQAAFTAELSMRAKDTPVVKKLDEQIKLQRQDQNLQQQIVGNLDRLVAQDEVVVDM